jgi:hypothetical protein
MRTKIAGALLMGLLVGIFTGAWLQEQKDKKQLEEWQIDQVKVDTVSFAYNHVDTIFFSMVVITQQGKNVIVKQDGVILLQEEYVQITDAIEGTPPVAYLGHWDTDNVFLCNDCSVLIEIDRMVVTYRNGLTISYFYGETLFEEGYDN